MQLIAHLPLRCNGLLTLIFWLLGVWLTSLFVFSFDLCFNHSKKRLAMSHAMSWCYGLLTLFLCLASGLLFNTNCCEDSK